MNEKEFNPYKKYYDKFNELTQFKFSEVKDNQSFDVFCNNNKVSATFNLKKENVEGRDLAVVTTNIKSTNREVNNFGVELVKKDIAIDMFQFFVNNKMVRFRIDVNTGKLKDSKMFDASGEEIIENNSVSNNNPELGLILMREASIIDSIMKNDKKIVSVPGNESR